MRRWAFALEMKASAYRSDWWSPHYKNVGAPFSGNDAKGPDQRSQRPLYGLAITRNPFMGPCGFGNALNGSVGENSLPVNYLTDSIHVKC